MLCLYTDGLVERRDRPIDDGIARLSATLRATDPEAACASVVAGMSNHSPHEDDVALLILRRVPGPPGDSGPDLPNGPAPVAGRTWRSAGPAGTP